MQSSAHILFILITCKPEKVYQSLTPNRHKYKLCLVSGQIAVWENIPDILFILILLIAAKQFLFFNN